MRIEIPPEVILQAVQEYLARQGMEWEDMRWRFDGEAPTISVTGCRFKEYTASV